MSLSFYKEGELNKAQDFKSVSELYSKNKPPPFEPLKKLNLVLISILCISSFLTNTFSDMFVYLTMLWVQFAIYSSFLEAILTRNPSLSIDKAPFLNKFQHGCYTLCIFLTPVVVPLYWSMLHHSNLQRVTDMFAEKEDQRLKNVFYAQCYLCHSIPAISAGIQMYTFNEHLIHRHANLLCLFAISFGLWNCYVAKSTGKVTYWFMTWQDWKSWVILVFLVLIPVCVFCVIASFDKNLTAK